MKKSAKKYKSLVLVSTGNDWEGLFVDGKKVYEHHEVSNQLISKWSAKTGLVIEKKWTTAEETSKTEDCGCFPELLKDMELED